MDTVRPAKSLDQFSAMQCLMSLQNCSAGLRHGHGPIRAGPAARLSESLGFCSKLYSLLLQQTLQQTLQQYSSLKRFES